MASMIKVYGSRNENYHFTDNMETEVVLRTRNGEYVTNANTTFGIVATGTYQQARRYSLRSALETVAAIEKYGHWKLICEKVY